MIRYLLTFLLTLPVWAQWTPTSVDSLQLWYESDNLTTVGTNVDAFLDKTANNYDMLITAAAPDTPQVIASELFGNAAVDFSGNSDSRYGLSPEVVVYSPSWQGSPHSYAVVFKAANITSSQAVWGQKFPNVHTGFYSAPNSRVELQYQSSSSTKVARGSTNLQADSVYIVIITHGAAADQIWVDSTAESITYRAGTAFGATVDDTPLATDYTVLGNSVSSATRNFAGNLYHFSFYSDSLTSAQVGQLYTYLYNKYKVLTVTADTDTDNRFEEFPRWSRFPRH